MCSCNFTTEVEIMLSILLYDNLFLCVERGAILHLVFHSVGFQRSWDKTMANRLMYIPNENTQIALSVDYN